MNLNRLNLNLLISLDRLLKERHVTRAANLLGVSQAAMSAQLSQLRELFQDDLLVRVGGEMLLTERAKEIEPRLSRLVMDAQNLVDTLEDFDPLTSDKEIIFGVGDYGAMLFLDKLMMRISERAPRIKLRLKRQTYLKSLHEFSSNGLHLALNYYRDPPLDLMVKKLYTETLVCLISKDHPLASKKLSQALLTQSRLAFVYYADEHGSSNILSKLKKQGIKLNPTLTMPYFGPGIMSVAKTDLILIAPRHLAEKYQDNMGYIIKPFPIKLEPTTVSLYWQKQHTHAKWHEWLREQIIEIVSFS